MKTLEKQFVCNADKSGKHIFKQIRRDDKVAFYQRIRPDGSHFDYEVFLIKTVKAGTALPGGKKVQEDYEQYPGAAQWGKTAWSPGSFSNAEEKFNQLVARVTDGINQPKRTGRKRKFGVDITLPIGEFTMKLLIDQNNQPQSVLYPKLQKFIGDGLVKKIGVIKPESGRGRGQIIYKSVVK
jgi:hypothetical protein